MNRYTQVDTGKSLNKRYKNVTIVDENKDSVYNLIESIRIDNSILEENVVILNGHIDLKANRSLNTIDTDSMGTMENYKIGEVAHIAEHMRCKLYKEAYKDILDTLLDETANLSTMRRYLDMLCDVIYRASDRDLADLVKGLLNKKSVLDYIDTLGTLSNRRDSKLVSQLLEELSLLDYDNYINAHVNSLSDKLGWLASRGYGESYQLNSGKGTNIVLNSHDELSLKLNTIYSMHKIKGYLTQRLMDKNKETVMVVVDNVSDLEIVNKQLLSFSSIMPAYKVKVVYVTDSMSSLGNIKYLVAQQGCTYFINNVCLDDIITVNSLVESI